MAFNNEQEYLYPDLQNIETPYDMPLDMVCTLDPESVDFLEKRLKGTINPELKTRKDHMRIVFYFKCCGIQDALKEKNNQNGKTEPFINLIKTNKEIDKSTNKESCLTQNRENKQKSLKKLQKHSMLPFFFEKDKADFLFEYFYQYVKDFQTLLMAIDTSNDEGMKKLEDISLSYQTASHFILAESLKTHLHLKSKNQDNGNIHITQTAPILILSQYFNDHPDLAETLDNKYSVFEHAMANIAPFIPFDANKYDYLSIAKEQPEAALALALICKNKQEKAPCSICISSPQDFKQKIKDPAVVDFATNIHADDLITSLKNAYSKVPSVSFDQNKTSKPYSNTYFKGNTTWNIQN